MNGKKAKALRKKYKVQPVYHFNPDGTQTEDYIYTTAWRGYATGKLTEAGTPEVKAAPVHVAELATSSSRKQYLNAKKEYTTTQEII